jgi:probable rRNA maturation factor
MAADVALHVDPDCSDVPSEEMFTQWVRAALPADRQSSALSIRVVTEAEGRELNHRYRKLDKATNVLSFRSELPAEISAQLDMKPLGDLVICAAVVEREARDQGKLSDDHWAHLTVHGVLHLLGHDHQDESSAAAMEALEIRILNNVNVPDPYECR